MTKNILIQYCDLQEEIKELQEEIDKTNKEIERLEKEPESDCVKGSYSDYPYINHTITIFGTNTKKKDNLHTTLKKKKARQEIQYDRLLELFTAVEEYIENIDNSRIRRIFRFKYVDKLTWIQVAHRIGGHATAESVRKECERFLEK